MVAPEEAKVEGKSHFHIREQYHQCDKNGPVVTPNPKPEQSAET